MSAIRCRRCTSCARRRDCMPPKTPTTRRNNPPTRNNQISAKKMRCGRANGAAPPKNHDTTVVIPTTMKKKEMMKMPPIRRANGGAWRRQARGCGEELKLRRREIDRRAAARHLHPRVVDDEIAAPYYVAAGARRINTPQHGTHARHQFPRAERLRHVVVGAKLETGEAIGLLDAGREHDDRHVALAT